MNEQANARIATAVDSFVSLVYKKKRISVEEVAQTLGLPESVINEWATFLEEEGVLDVDYQFTTPFITVKKETKALEEEKSASEIEKDLLLRKINFMGASLDKYSLNPKVKEYKLAPTIEIKSLKDLKRAIKSSKLSGDNRLYAQKIYLKIKLAQLLRRLKSNEEILAVNKDASLLEKRKKIFENNFKKKVKYGSRRLL